MKSILKKSYCGLINACCYSRIAQTGIKRETCKYAFEGQSTIEASVSASGAATHKEASFRTIQYNIIFNSKEDK